MSTQISKRALSAGLGVGALALLAQTQSASADTPFTNFTFTATGTPKARTMPDRLAEVVNVKDWGAKGDGATDDSAAIHDAIVSIGANGTVFFPPGIYIVNSTIDLMSATNNIFLTLRGVGANASVIKSNSGTMTGYIFQYTQVGGGSQCITIEHLGITNTNITAGGCVQIVGQDSFEMRGCIITGYIGLNCAGTSPVQLLASAFIHNCIFICSAGTVARAGSIGIVVGPHSSIQSCSIVNFDNGIRTWGVGSTILNCRIEVNNTGIVWGQDITGANFSVTAGLIAGCTFEGNLTGLYVNTAVFCTIASCAFEQGTNGPPTGSATSQYGLQIQSCQNLTLISCEATGAFTQKGFYIAGQPSRLVFINCDAGSFGTTAGVVYSNMTQINCVNFPSFATNVNLLPGKAGNASALPTQGERRFVTDATSTTFGSFAVGSGGNFVPVTYNGSQWVIG